MSAQTLQNGGTANAITFANPETGQQTPTSVGLNTLTPFPVQAAPREWSNPYAAAPGSTSPSHGHGLVAGIVFCNPA
jgi:hypothetical protein